MSDLVCLSWECSTAAVLLLVQEQDPTFLRVREEIVIASL